eukprot:scaffold14290_cov125-Isochrysis_galbana.AAC.17
MTSRGLCSATPFFDLLADLFSRQHAPAPAHRPSGAGGALRLPQRYARQPGCHPSLALPGAIIAPHHCISLLNQTLIQALLPVSSKPVV